MKNSSATSIDPILFEVIRNGLQATNNEMALVIAKTAYSTPVNEGRDFSSTIYDSEGNLASQGQFDLPGFTGVTLLTVPHVIASIGIEKMREGDVYLINDPYVASTHCNDVHAVKPVFLDGCIVAFVATAAHWSDVGGAVPGSLSAWARSHFEEGIRIPVVTAVKAGEMNHDLMDLLWANMRQSWERKGDFHAQLSALAAGEKRIREIAMHYGVNELSQTMAQVQDHSERLIRAALASMPDGTYLSHDSIDQDVHTGETKTIRLALTIRGDEAQFDLTGSDSAAECAFNCPLPATTSAVFIALASILPPMPTNAGLMRAVTINTVPGSIVHALPPSPVSGMVATTMECVVSVSTLALSLAFPERGAASPFSILNAVMAGFDDRAEFSSSYINYAWGFGGLGATLTNDGATCVGSPYASTTQYTPCELQERRYPVLYWRNMFLQDHGGPGRTRGGLGHDQIVIFTHSAGTLSCVGNREKVGPPGVFGGSPGRLAHLILNHGAEDERNAGIFAANAFVDKAEHISYWSAGGGGYGDPLEREVERVLEDVLDEYVSIERAQSDYGVIVNVFDWRKLDVRVDLDATTKLRTEMRDSKDGVSL